MNDDLFPPIDETLVNKLEELYPEKCPEITASDREIWLYAGSRMVVRMLRAVYLEQQMED